MIDYTKQLESEVETLRARLEEASFWKPWWKEYEYNPHRFDYMVGKCHLVTITLFRPAGKEPYWQVATTSGVVHSIEKQTKEEAFEYTERYIKERGFGQFV
jgi:hypothetical protein